MSVLGEVFGVNAVTVGRGALDRYSEGFDVGTRIGCLQCKEVCHFGGLGGYFDVVVGCVWYHGNGGGRVVARSCPALSPGVYSCATDLLSYVYPKLCAYHGLSST